MDLRMQVPEFEIIDETDDYIVVDKPAHLLVHPATRNQPPTLLDGLQDLLIYDLAIGGSLSIITRLDRETSGIVLVAKHAAQARTFGMAMEAREFSKTYLAIVAGHPSEDEFVVDAPLHRRGEVEPSEIWVKQIVHPIGRQSKTGFKVLERFTRPEGDFALLECHPITGRMHQIRVHAAHAGHGIVGDKMYGPDEANYLEFIKTGWTPELESRLFLNRQALHAHRLEWRGHRWECALPDELQRFIDQRVC